MRYRKLGSSDLAPARGTEALARAGAPSDELIAIAEAALASLARPESAQA
jgi:hypothetical protein